MPLLENVFGGIIESAIGLLAFGTPGLIALASMLVVLLAMVISLRDMPVIGFFGILAFLTMGFGVAMYAESLRIDAGCIARDFATYREITAQRITAVSDAVTTTVGTLDKLAHAMIRQADANVVYATANTANPGLVLSGSRNMLQYSNDLHPLVEQLRASGAMLNAIVPYNPGCAPLVP